MNSDVLTERAIALFNEYAEVFYDIPREAGGPPGVPEDIRNVEDELQERGWSFKGRGSARTVFGIPDSLTSTSRELVVKFPLQPEGVSGEPWRDGINQTETEVEMFYDAKVDTTYLAPIRAFDDYYRWVVMEDVDNFDPERTGSGLPATLENRLDDALLQPGDFHEGNLGWLPVDERDPGDELHEDGRRLVMMDYGMLSTINPMRA
jgi:hypothetical protein